MKDFWCGLVAGGLSLDELARPFQEWLDRIPFCFLFVEDTLTIYVKTIRQPVTIQEKSCWL